MPVYRVVNEAERDLFEKTYWEDYDYSGDDCLVTNSLFLAKLWFKHELTPFEKKYFIIEKVNSEGREVIYKEGYFIYDKDCFYRGENAGHNVVRSPVENL